MRWAGGDGPVVGSAGPLRTYTVGVEEEIDISPDALAGEVERILGDERSWIGVLDVRLQRVESGSNIRVVLATPATVDRLCAPLRTNGEVSCFKNGRVVLNVKRWTQGAATWGADVAGYREYLVNHEFGHALGRQHVSCPQAGALAPVMVQQSISLGGCQPNAWPTLTGG